MTIDPASPPRPRQKDPPGALVVSDHIQNQIPEEREQTDTDFITQVTQRAREEWELFHREHPEIDEETFVEAQRFCLKQWFRHQRITFADLPAFEQAEQHFARELEQRADQIEASAYMLEDPIFGEAQLLGVSIAIQARERSKQVREGIEALGSKTYLASKIQTMRVQEREQAAQQRLEQVRQEVEDLKALGITRVYENQKEALLEREQAFREHMSALDHLREESHQQADEARYILRCEEYISNVDILMEALHKQTLDAYRVRDGGGTILGDGDAARQRAKQTRALAETVQALIQEMQESIQDVLTRAQAETVHERLTKQTLERTRQRRAEIKAWAQEEIQQAEERRKTLQEGKESYVNVMIKARNTVFGENVTQAKAIDRVITTEEKLIRAIEQARSKTQETIEHFKEIYTCYREIKEYHLKIEDEGVKCVKSFEDAKQALERAICAAEAAARNAQQACEQQSRAQALPDLGAEAKRTEKRARYIAKEELQAYVEAKKYGAAALLSLQEISAEYSAVEERATGAVKHVADLLENILPFERDVLDRAIAGVKNTVKASMTLLRAEEQAKAAAHQMITRIETGEGADTVRLIANEHEALLLAAFANHALMGYATLYYVFHTLAGHIIREQLETSIDASTEQFGAALQGIKKGLDAIHQQKKSLQAQRRQVAIPSGVLQRAHLLIDERTGVLTLKDGGAALHLQDLAGIEGDESGGEGHGRGGGDHGRDKSGPYERRNELRAGEGNSGWSRLVFKVGDCCSSYDVPHELVHEGCEASTRIHLRVPDGMGGHMAVLLLPNGTYIKVADVDLGQTSCDPARPECGVTITLKSDGCRINLLAAASVMRASLVPDALRELMERHLDQSRQRLVSALEAKDIEGIENAFRKVRTNDLRIKYIEHLILSSEEQAKRYQDLKEWMQSIQEVTSHLADTLRAMAYEVVNDEQGAQEITEQVVIEQAFSGQVSEELFHKRAACLQQIASARGLDRVINCQLLKDPDEESAGTYPNPTIQEVLFEYERATACQMMEQQQEGRASDKWTRYLADLRRIILNGAPAFFRTKFLISQLREAIEANQWELGRAEELAVMDLAQELQAVGEQSDQADNDYANVLHVFLQRAVVGIQSALKIGDPLELLCRLGVLDLPFSVFHRVESRVWQALDPMTPTAMARELLEPIGSGEGKEIPDDAMAQQSRSKEREQHVTRPA